LRRRKKRRRRSFRKKSLPTRSKLEENILNLKNRLLSILVKKELYRTDMDCPKPLYSLATVAVVNNFKRLKSGLDICPENVVFDVIYESFKRKQYQLLCQELTQFTTFTKLLRMGDRRGALHKMFQAGTEHDSSITDTISQEYSTEVDSLLDRLGPQPLKLRAVAKTIETGYSLGGFLCEAGWYPAATTVYRAALTVLRRMNKNEPSYLQCKLETLSKLLHSLSSYCCFDEATALADELLSLLVSSGSSPTSSLSSFASLYNELSSHCFMKSQYQDSYSWALKAVKLLTPSLPPKLKIDVLRQASKACVVKREFSKAEMLVKEAVRLAKGLYGTSHTKYADCLIDYGFYLLNVDCITASMQVYKSALDVRLECFGKENLQVAVAHEDLAYATYVNEYSTGKFGDARRHAQASLAILSRHLPKNHLLLASSKRVLALILEEIAIDNQDRGTEKKLLNEAEELHLFALRLAILSFGESNVQTAKHYGNLGRLYQTMQRYQEAEKMHLKAIQIKESLLGLEDYEVALSVGHLASLYNYDMEQYLKAEELYLRSIAIGRQLFGPSYSGLEYDYRGLIQVYQMTTNFEKFIEFTGVLQDWKILRDLKDAEQGSAEVDVDGNTLSLDDLIKNVTSLPDLVTNSRLCTGAHKGLEVVVNT